MCLPTRQDGPLRRHAPVYSNKNVQQQNVFVVSSFHPPLNKFKVSKVYSEKKNCKQKDKLENVLKAWQGTGPGPWPRGRENSRSRAAQTRATPARGRARGNRHSAELTGARATQKKGGRRTTQRASARSKLPTKEPRTVKTSARPMGAYE